MPQLSALKLFGLGAVVIAFLGLMLALSMANRQNDKLARQIEKCSEARKADRLSYERAQADAKAKNLTEVKAIEARQEKTNAETKSKYAADLARLRAGGVRQDLAAPSSPAGKPGVSGNAAPTCRADEQNVLVSRALIMRAAEIELGRNALIDWINQQSR